MAIKVSQTDLRYSQPIPAVKAEGKQPPPPPVFRGHALIVLFAGGTLHHTAVPHLFQMSRPQGECKYCLLCRGKHGVLGVVRSTTASASTLATEACLGRGGDASLAAVRALRAEEPCFACCWRMIHRACMHVRGTLKQRATFALRGIQQQHHLIYIQYKYRCWGQGGFFHPHHPLPLLLRGLIPALHAEQQHSRS